MLQKEGSSLAPGVCKQRPESLMGRCCRGDWSMEQAIRPQNPSSLEILRCKILIRKQRELRTGQETGCTEGLLQPSSSSARKLRSAWRPSEYPCLWETPLSPPQGENPSALLAWPCVPGSSAKSLDVRGSQTWAPVLASEGWPQESYLTVLSLGDSEYPRANASEELSTMPGTEQVLGIGSCHRSHCNCLLRWTRWCGGQSSCLASVGREWMKSAINRQLQQQQHSRMRPSFRADLRLVPAWPLTSSEHWESHLVFPIPTFFSWETWLMLVFAPPPLWFAACATGDIVNHRAPSQHQRPYVTGRG